MNTWEQCPAKYDLLRNKGFKTVPDDNPQNALILGSSLHKGLELDVQAGIDYYFMSYPVITDYHINEAIKLEYLIKKGKEFLPEGLHEVIIETSWYKGTLDLLVPATKHDLNLPKGMFDLYDFKYSNNIERYLETKQLHVYKAMYEVLTGRKIRNMYFVFFPKVQIRQKKNETLGEFRRRIIEELESKEITKVKVDYDLEKLRDWFQAVVNMNSTNTFPKCESYLCRWCEFNDYCKKGDETMIILPSEERRIIGQQKKRRIWIYGGAFSGKTTFTDSAPTPLNLNTDGNIQFVTMPFMAIKDRLEGRQKILAWETFKEIIDELEKKDNNFETIVVDLLEDTYEYCRLYMYEKLGISHESDDSFSAWDKVRTEFLSVLRRLMNLDYENIILISHEDTSKDITKKSGDKITSIRPNMKEKVANKIAGMVDIVARVIVEDDDTRKLSFKTNEVIFGGGRLKGLTVSEIPLDWNALCDVYDEANQGRKEHTEPKKKVDDSFIDVPEGIEAEEIPFDEDPKPEPAKEEEPKPRQRRSRKERTDD